MAQRKRNTPPLTDEALDNKIIALTKETILKDLEEGVPVPSQLKVHFLQLQTKKEEAQIRKLELDIELTKAKIAAEEDRAKQAASVQEVIEALKSYSFKQDDDIY